MSSTKRQRDDAVCVCVRVCTCVCVSSGKPENFFHEGEGKHVVFPRAEEVGHALSAAKNIFIKHNTSWILWVLAWQYPDSYNT